MNFDFSRKLSISLYIIFTIISNVSSAQTIKINDIGLFINSQKITQLTDPQKISHILGKPDRKYLKVNTIWIYDYLGMRVYIDPSTESLKSISFDLIRGKFDFSPIYTFSGEFILYGNDIGKYTPIISLKKLKELTFDNLPISVYKAVCTYLSIIFDYSNNENLLGTVSVSFR